MKQKIIIGLFVLTVISIGFFLRIHNIADQYPFHDEINMLHYVKGFLSEGYPHKQIGPVKMPINTSELLPYPIALSVTLFGFNDVAAKLPAVLFGTITIFMLYVAGRKLFNAWVGIFAATIYAFHPQSIIWAQTLYHPQQTQLAALVTSYLFYRAIENEALNIKYLYLAMISYIVTYLSWEGTGFLLPAFFAAAIALKGRDLAWLKNRHIWYASLLVGLVVFIQLAVRIFAHQRFLVYGQGLSDISTPLPVFLDAMYDPLAYIKKLFWIENNAILTLVFLAGIPLVIRNRPLRYYYVLLVAVVFMMTNFFLRSSYRYGHYLEVFLVLSASAICVLTAQHIWRLKSRGTLWSYSVIKGIGAASLLVIVFLYSNTFFLKTYRLGYNAEAPMPLTRLGIPYIDYRSPSLFLQSHLREGDSIISIQPFSVVYYAGLRSHYYLETYPAKQTFYDISGETLGFLDKFIGTPVIRSYDEFREVVNSNQNRIWIMSVSDQTFNKINDSRIQDFIRNNTKVVYESYDAKVYLWNR